MSRVKICPTCNRTYADEGISFCLLDGAILSASYNPQETVVLPKNEEGELRATDVPPQEKSASTPEKKGIAAKLIAATALTILLMGGLVLWLGKSWKNDSHPEPNRQLTNQESATDTNRKLTSKQSTFSNKIGMQFALIPGGSSLIGSSESEVDAAFADAMRTNSSAVREKFSVETPQHQVTIKDDYYMGKFEVTQAQWRTLMGNNPSHFRNCDSCPVEQVSWYETQEFIGKLNRMDEEYSYRLPSEAEWEYACRAGTTTAFAFGDSLNSSQANFNGNNPFGNAPKGIWVKATTPVGSYQPNAWGLYDMHGNVFEWVEDICSNSYNGLPVDGSPNMNNGDARYRILRGGSWTNHAKYCRSAFRNCITPDYSYLDSGFRIVAVLRK
jgi:formylglycine-generating enzyme required for sulfatase activity